MQSRKLLLLMLLVALSFSFQMQPTRVSCNNATINVVTFYTFVITRSSDPTGVITPWDTELVPAGSSLTIKFPTTYNTAYGYTAQVNNANYPLVQSGQNITITGLFSTSTALETLTLVISNVLNPSPAVTTDEFLCYLGNDYTSTTSDNYASVTLTPGKFQSCSISFSPSTVNKTAASMVVTVTIQNTVPAGSTMLVTLPSLGYWFYDIARQSFPVRTSMTCTNISSNINSVVTCVGGTASSTARTITASGLFSSSLSSGTSFGFSIASMLSPPTVTSNRDAITIATLTGGNMIDTCSIAVTGLTANSLTVSIGAPSQSSSIVVNQNTSLRCSITLSDVMNNGDTISIVFPSGSKIFSPSLTGQISFGSGSTSGSTATFSMTSVRNLSSGYILNVTFSTYTAPTSTQATLPFTFNILRDGNIKMAGTATLQASMSALSFTVSPLSLVVNANTSYTFRLTIGDQLSSSGRVIITFPASITQQWTSSSCALLSGNGVASTATCTLSSSSTLVLSNLNSSSSNIPTQSLTITVAGIGNPASTQPSGVFNITTYFSSTDDTSVSTGAMGSVTATPAALNNFNVLITPSSYLVRDTNVAYTVSFVTTSPIPVGGYVVLGIPYSIETAINSVGGLCSAATSTSATLSSVSCTGGVNNTSSSMYEITFTNLFASQGVSAGANITLKVSSVFTNPVSTDSVSSFSITTYTGTAYAVDRSNTGLAVAMTTPADFSIVNITPTSKVNSAVTSYSFTLAQPSVFSTGSKLEIVFPGEIVPQSSATCSDGASATVACLVNSQTVTINLPSTVANTNFTVTVGAVKNYFSLKPSGKFGFATRTPSGGYYSRNLSTITVANTIPSTFSSLSSTFSPQELYTSISLSVTLQPSNTISGSLTLSLASSFVVGALSCSLSFSGNCNTGSNTITISSISGPSTLTFSLSGLTSPKTAPIDYSTLTSFDSSNYIIDQSSSQIIFTTNCTPPCKTCSTTSSTCTSCYSDTSITTSVYFTSATNRCVDACEPGYYADSTQWKCNACTNVCYTCQTISTNCTSCNSTSLYPYLNKTSGAGTCLAACPSGMYADTNQSPTLCVNCVSPCVTCLTQTACSSCISGAYLYLTSCLASCPISISILNVALNLCQACDAVCATCSVIISNCTACANGTAYYNYNCVSSCPTGMVIKSNTCVSCDSPCVTCSNTTTNCTSCNSSTVTPYLLNNSCLASCPSTYYNDSSTGNCLLCSLLSLNCNICSNSTACISCNTGYIFFNYTCLLTAPPGYVNISGQALPCTGDCGTCDVLQSNCTSCKTLNYLNYQCLASCPATYAAVSGICQVCSSPCLTCSQTVTNCTSCIASLTPSVYLSNGLCLTTCPTGSYANSIDSTCTVCVSPCLTCSSVSQCASCEAGYYLYQQSCLRTCPAGYVGVAISCVICTSPCQTCSASATTCTSCLPNLSPAVFLTGTSCVLASNCPTQTYANRTNNECVSCVPPCQTCTSSTTCTACISDYSLQAGLCTSSCLTGYTPINSVCTICTQPCSTCAGTTTTCLSCNQTTTLYYLYNNYCFTSCPSTKYGNAATYQCLTCVSPCYTCSSSATCLACLAGYYLYLSTCITTCPSGYVGVVTSCQLCTLNCRTCVNTTSICTSCVSGYYLISASNQCLTSCPTGLYPNSMTGTCTGCQAPCATCSAFASNCTTCSTGYLYGSTCENPCPQGYYPENGTNCAACSFGCAVCKSPTVCTTCLGAYLSYQQACVSSCPTDLPVVKNGLCTACSLLFCLICDSGDNCRRCNAPFLLYQADCVSSCPENYTSDGQTCLSNNPNNNTSNNNTSNNTNTTYPNTTNNTTTQTLTNSFIGSKMFPVPWALGGVVVAILCGVSKFNSPNTFASAAAYSLLGLLEWGALGTLGLLYYFDVNKMDIVVYAMLGIAGAIYLLNLATLLAMLIIYRRDKHFEGWLQSGNKTKTSYSITVIFSTLCSHKTANILFSRLFGLFVFRAQLDTVKGFFPLHLISYLSLVPSLSAVGLASYICYNNMANPNQIFLEGLDVIILGIVNLVMAISNSQKAQDFFEEKEGQMTLNKRNVDSESIMIDGMSPEGVQQKQVNIGKNQFASVRSQSQNSIHTILDPILHSHRENILEITLREAPENCVRVSRQAKHPASKKPHSLEDSNSFSSNISEDCVIYPSKAFQDVSIQAYDMLELDGQQTPLSSERTNNSNIHENLPKEGAISNSADLKEIIANGSQRNNSQLSLPDLSVIRDPNREGNRLKEHNTLNVEGKLNTYEGNITYQNHEKSIFRDLSEEASPQVQLCITPSLQVTETMPISEIHGRSRVQKTNNLFNNLLIKEHSVHHADFETQLGKGSSKSLQQQPNQERRSPNTEKISHQESDHLKALQHSFEQLSKEEVIWTTRQSKLTFFQEDQIVGASEYGSGQLFAFRSQLIPKEEDHRETLGYLLEPGQPDEDDQINQDLEQKTGPQHQSECADQTKDAPADNGESNTGSNQVYQTSVEERTYGNGLAQQLQEKQQNSTRGNQQLIGNQQINGDEGDAKDIPGSETYKHEKVPLVNKKSAQRHVRFDVEYTDRKHKNGEVQERQMKASETQTPVKQLFASPFHKPASASSTMRYTEFKQRKVDNQSPVHKDLHRQASSMRDFNSSSGLSVVNCLVPLQIQIEKRPQMAKGNDIQQLIVENGNIDDSFHQEDDLYKRPLSRLSPPKKQLNSVRERCFSRASNTVELDGHKQSNQIAKGVQESKRDTEEMQRKLKMRQLKYNDMKERGRTVVSKDSQLLDSSADAFDFAYPNNTLVPTEYRGLPIQYHMKKNKDASTAMRVFPYDEKPNLETVDFFDAAKLASTQSNNFTEQCVKARTRKSLDKKDGDTESGILKHIRPGETKPSKEPAYYGENQEFWRAAEDREDPKKIEPWFGKDIPEAL